MKRGGISATSLAEIRIGAEPRARVSAFGVRGTVRWWGTECGNLSRHSKTVTRSINWLAWSCGFSPSFHPCTERSLVELLLGGDPRSQTGQVSHSHTRELVNSALLKLKALAFIEFSREHIAITDKGKRCLVDLLVTLQRGRSADVRDTKADHQVATDHDEQDEIKGTAKAKVTQPFVFKPLSTAGATPGALSRSVEGACDNFTTGIRPAA